PHLGRRCHRVVILLVCLLLLLLQTGRFIHSFRLLRRQSLASFLRWVEKHKTRPLPLVVLHAPRRRASGSKSGWICSLPLHCLSGRRQFALVDVPDHTAPLSLSFRRSLQKRKE